MMVSILVCFRQYLVTDRPDEQRIVEVIRQLTNLSTVNGHVQCKLNVPDATVVQCPADYIVKGYDYNIKQVGEEPSKNNRTDYNILILTPFSDSVSKLTKYFQLMCSLTYPHARISIALGTDSGFDAKTLHEARAMATRFRTSFRNVSFHELDVITNKVSHARRHDFALQPTRRMHMALSRNELLFRAMTNEHDWIIWVDVDLAYIPPNIIQLLLSPNQPIVTPVCLMNKKPYDTYDWNMWRETPKSRDHIAKQKALHEDFVMIETRMSLRKRLIELRGEGNAVPIDGVGACCLLVRASCHRQGLIFPAVMFDSHVESEGLAKMATKLGIPVYGLTHVQVFHNMTHMY
jgi:hypothetical protein